MTQLTPEQLIGEGLLSEIYRWSDGRVLKLFRAGLPDVYVHHEGQITQAAAAAGLPVPAVGEVVQIDTRYGLELAYIAGPSLMAFWLQNPAASAAVGQMLADLHTQLHSHTLSQLESLPSQREWLGNNIQDTPALSDEVKAAVLMQLDKLPPGEQLCHGDFHPGNILLEDGSRPVIIDWFAATRGQPAADVARTALLLEFAYLPPNLFATDNPRLIRQQLCDAYVQHYFNLRPELKDSFAAWQVVIAAASFCEDFFQETDEIYARVLQGI